MKEYVKQVWQNYHNHAPFWLEHIVTPSAAGGMIHDVFPLVPPTPKRFFSSETSLSTTKSPITITPNYGVEESKIYMDDPSKCTPSPWVYYSERHFPEIDFVWLDSILKNRTRDYDRIREDLYEGAVELSKVQPCYNLVPLARYTKEAALDDMMNILFDTGFEPKLSK